jgi:hypothetical protein
VCSAISLLFFVSLLFGAGNGAQGLARAWQALYHYAQSSHCHYQKAKKQKIAMR